MVNEYRDRLLACLEGSYLDAAKKLLLLAEMNRPFEAGAARRLGVARLARLREVFARDTFAPVTASSDLRELVEVMHSAEDLRVNAWLLLQAMDRALGAQWTDRFVEETRLLRLEPNALFPIGHVDLDLLLKARGTQVKLSARPSSLANPLFSLHHLGVWPGAGELGVQVKFHQQELSFHRVACCFPNASVDTRDFEAFEVALPDGTPGFFPLRAKNIDEQWRLIGGHLNRAKADGADLVLFPELSMTEELQRRVGEWMHDAEFAGTVLAGSAHVETGPERVNRAVLRRGAVCELHHKLNPFVTPKENPFFPKREVIEDLRGPRNLTLHFFGSLSVAFVVCKDVGDPAIRRALELLRPSLLLIVALSPTTDFFTGQAEALRDVAQTITVVANAPATPDVSTTVCVLPLRRLLEHVRDEPHGVPHPGNRADPLPENGYQLLDLTRD